MVRKNISALRSVSILLYDAAHILLLCIIRAASTIYMHAHQRDSMYNLRV